MVAISIVIRLMIILVVINGEVFAIVVEHENYRKSVLTLGLAPRGPRKGREGVWRLRRRRSRGSRARRSSPTLRPRTVRPAGRERGRADARIIPHAPGRATG